MVTTIHMQLLSTWNMANVTGERDFQFYVIVMYIANVISGYHPGQRGSRGTIPALS